MDGAVVKPQRAITGGRNKILSRFLTRDMTQAIAEKEEELKDSDEREERHRKA